MKNQEKEETGLKDEQRSEKKPEKGDGRKKKKRIRLEDKIEDDRSKL